MRDGLSRKKAHPSPTSRGSQPTAAANPTARLSASAAGTGSMASASMVTASSGLPAASRTSDPGDMLAAVRLASVVATTTSRPSHQAETAIKWGLPSRSAVASHMWPCFSSISKASALRVAVSLTGPSFLCDRVDVEAPAAPAGGQVPSALEAETLQRDLPTVFAAEAMNESGRRAHDANAFHVGLEQPGRDRLRGLARRRGGALIVHIRAGQHGQLGERGEREGFAGRKLRGVEARVVARR